MFIIIEKGKRWVQMQVEDYLGKIKVKFIDLHNKHGRIQFAKIFCKNKRTETEEEEEEENKSYQKILEDFGFKQLKKSTLSGTSSFRLPYRKEISVVQPDEFTEGKLSWAEIEALRRYKNSDGYLKDLFILNDFSYWDELELSIKQEEIFGRFFIGDLVKLEIGRCKLGRMKFDEWVRELDSNPKLISAFNLENERIPGARNYGRLVTNIGSDNLRAFHGLLVNEFKKYGLIDYQVGVWDGRFFMSNCGVRKQEKIEISSDPECGICVKGKYKGPGYTESPIMDWKFNLIVYYDAVEANRNDKVAFRETFQGYLANGGVPFTYFITDGGAGVSHKNLEMVSEGRSIPILRWKKSSTPNVIKAKKGLYFNIDFVPKHVIPHMSKIYDLRTKEERMFSPFKIVYNRTRMPNQGKENALIFISFNAITQGLNALTAYKTGRKDLIKSASAFRDVYINLGSEMVDKNFEFMRRQIYQIY